LSGSSQALPSIQILRAVAALGVLTYHTFFDTTFRFGAHLVPHDFVIGAAGVDLFFVISGFVMVYASERLFGKPGASRVFLVRRLARIVPLYWAVMVIILAYVLAIYGQLLPEVYSAGSVIASFLFYPYARPDGTMALVHGLGWTLNYEMFFYTVFAMAILLPQRWAVTAILALFLALSLLGRLVALPMPFSFWCSPIILEFCFGMLIALAWREGVRLPPAMSSLLVLAAMAGFAASAAWGPNAPWRAIEWGLPSAALVAGLVLSNRSGQPGRIGRAFGFLGDASYSIYLVHPLWLPIPRWTLARWIDFTAHPWVYALAIFFGAIAAAIASYILFEKPITRALRRYMDRRRVPCLEGAR